MPSSAAVSRAESAWATGSVPSAGSAPFSQSGISSASSAWGAGCSLSSSDDSCRRFSKKSVTPVDSDSSISPSVSSPSIPFNQSGISSDALAGLGVASGSCGTASPPVGSSAAASPNQSGKPSSASGSISSACSAASPASPASALIQSGRSCSWLAGLGSGSVLGSSWISFIQSGLPLSLVLSFWLNKVSKSGPSSSTCAAAADAAASGAISLTQSGKSAATASSGSAAASSSREKGEESSSMSPEEGSHPASFIHSGISSSLKDGVRLSSSTGTGESSEAAASQSGIPPPGESGFSSSTPREEAHSGWAPVSGALTAASHPRRWMVTA